MNIIYTTTLNCISSVTRCVYVTYRSVFIQGNGRVIPAFVNIREGDSLVHTVLIEYHLYSSK